MTIRRSVDCLRGDHINCNRPPDECGCQCHERGREAVVADTINALNAIMVECCMVPSELLREPGDKNAAVDDEPLEDVHARLLSRLLAPWRRWLGIDASTAE